MLTEPEGQRVVPWVQSHGGGFVGELSALQWHLQEFSDWKCANMTPTWHNLSSYLESTRAQIFAISPTKNQFLDRTRLITFNGKIDCLYLLALG